MATTASTPPPPSSIHTPPTPRHGWEDNFEPFAPRKSTRVSAKRAQRLAQTPPPQAPSQGSRTHHSSPPSTTRQASSIVMPDSPPLTITKKRVAPMKDSRRVSGALDDESLTSAAAALGLPSKKREVVAEAHQFIAPAHHTGMLPTPDKTPRKRPNQVAPAISSIARNLFPVRPENIDEVMPSPRKKGRKHLSDFTLATDGGESASIEIFTDSHERIPEVDLGEENPFYGPGTVVAEPVKRASKRRRINVPGEGEQSFEEAEQREDGLVYVFRGKRIFRKFEEAGEDSVCAPEEEQDALDVELDATVPARLRGPLTRSAIKPRLLFPTQAQLAAKEASTVYHDDEEAVTDIDEALKSPVEDVEEQLVTPKAPKFAPVSPPTTLRATRSKKLASLSPASPVEETGGSTTARAKASPFDSWQRTKATRSRDSKKREGEPLSRAEGATTKRLRGSAS